MCVCASATSTTTRDWADLYRKNIAQRWK